MKKQSNLPLLRREDLPEKLQKLSDRQLKKVLGAALFDLAKDSVKSYLQAEKHKKMLPGLLEQWLSLKSENTQISYTKNVGDFFHYLGQLGQNPLLIQAVDVDQYLIYLNERYRPNSERQKVGAISSFYTQLVRYDIMRINPFLGSEKQKRQFLQTSKGEIIPVMSDNDFKNMILELIHRTHLKGSAAKLKNRRDAAMELLPVVHFLWSYGIRISEIPHLQIRKEVLIITDLKGKKTRTLPFESNLILKIYRLDRKTPFKGRSTNTIQNAIKRVTRFLLAEGIIPYAYTAHHFRHAYTARRLEETGGNLYQVMKELGHTSLQALGNYVRDIES